MWWLRIHLLTRKEERATYGNISDLRLMTRLQAEENLQRYTYNDTPANSKSRTADTFMSVTLQYITKSWELQSWCLDCCGLNTDHTAESLKEAFEEKLEDWNLDIVRISGITTDNATNNKKAFDN